MISILFLFAVVCLTQAQLNKCPDGSTPASCSIGLTLNRCSVAKCTEGVDCFSDPCDSCQCKCTATKQIVTEAGCSDAGCPAGTPTVNCFLDPCTSFANACVADGSCAANYCGGCNCLCKDGSKPNSLGVCGTAVVCPTGQKAVGTSCVCENGDRPVQGECCATNFKRTASGECACSVAFGAGLFGGCSCDAGFTLSGAGVCVETDCPPGWSRVDGKCQCTGTACQCPDGQLLKDGKCVAACPDAQELFDGRCVDACTFGLTRNSQGVCCSPITGCKCPAGQQSKDGVCVDLPCTAGFELNAAGNCQCAKTFGGLSQLCQCPTGESLSDDGFCTAVTCPVGWTAKDGECVCAGATNCKCAAGEELRDGVCVNVSCAEGFTRDSSDGVCKCSAFLGLCRCPATQNLVKGVCVDKPACAAGFARNSAGVCECSSVAGAVGTCQCPDGQELKNRVCVAIAACADGFKLNSNGVCECVALLGAGFCQCPDGQALVERVCVDKPACADGFTLNSEGVCECAVAAGLLNNCKCPEGQELRNGVCVAKQTSSCGAGFTVDAAERCVCNSALLCKCPDGQELNAQRVCVEVAVKCEPNQQWDEASQQCMCLSTAGALVPCASECPAGEAPTLCLLPSCSEKCLKAGECKENKCGGCSCVCAKGEYKNGECVVEDDDDVPPADGCFQKCSSDTLSSNNDCCDKSCVARGAVKGAMRRDSTSADSCGECVCACESNEFKLADKDAQCKQAEDPKDDPQCDDVSDKVCEKIAKNCKREATVDSAGCPIACGKVVCECPPIPPCAPVSPQPVCTAEQTAEAKSLVDNDGNECAWALCCAPAVTKDCFSCQVEIKLIAKGLTREQVLEKVVELLGDDAKETEAVITQDDTTFVVTLQGDENTAKKSVSLVEQLNEDERIETVDSIVQDTEDSSASTAALFSAATFVAVVAALL